MRRQAPDRRHPQSILPSRHSWFLAPFGFGRAGLFAAPNEKSRQGQTAPTALPSSTRRGGARVKRTINHALIVAGRPVETVASGEHFVGWLPVVLFKPTIRAARAGRLAGI